MAAVLFKVGLLTMKTAAKPLASRFEALVMNHPIWRQRVISMAQYIHRLDVSISRGAEGRTGRAFVADLNEEKAVQLASKVVSEGFIYTMGVVLLVVELNRKNKEDTVKKAKETAEKQSMRDLHERHLQTEQDLRQQLSAVSQQLRSLDERLAFMEEQMGRKRSWWPLFAG